MRSQIQKWRGIFSFEGWGDRLSHAALTPEQLSDYHFHISHFLKFSKSLPLLDSIDCATRYINRLGAEKGPAFEARQALRWLFKTERARLEPRDREPDRLPSENRTEVSSVGNSDKKELRGRIAPISPLSSYISSPNSNKPSSHPGSRNLVDKNELAQPITPPRRRSTPPLGRDDQGRSNWERALIQACRENHLLWRTEETYRRWGRQFQDFVRPGSVEQAGTTRIEEFLSYLATVQRSSPSTQKQALNALVFLFEKSLKKKVGEIKSHYAAPKRRVPTVLSGKECAGLIEALSGTSRLMAELMYGSGLRLMELLRLRIQDLDLLRLAQ